ncbi:MAG: CDP-alcohol phosphatidyltransferase family protein [Planctomycetaceae bacterium]|nr:CDP-alcohol phosphatidyltransferase family protein [Planctomycetaceae bacterium]
MRDAPGDDPAPRRRRRLYRPQVLPTLLTLGNLFCGFLAVAKAADALAVPHGPGLPVPREMVDLLAYAGWMIFLGMVFDALDGSVARLSGGSSALGAQLDSIADVVTFGVAPAFLAKCMAEGVGGMEDHKQTLFFSVFFALMAGLRLARYNAQHGDPEEEQLWFQGLPTPGAAGVVAGVALLLPDPEFNPESALLRLLPWAVLLLGVLMVSRAPYPHVTNRFLKGRKPVQYLVGGLLVLVLSLAFHFEVVLAGLLFAYALSGPVVGLLRRRRADPAPAPAAPHPADRREP